MADYTSPNMTFIGDFAQEVARLTANLWRSWAGDELRPNQIGEGHLGRSPPIPPQGHRLIRSEGDLHMCRSRRFRQQENARRLNRDARIVEVDSTGSATSH